MVTVWPHYVSDTLYLFFALLQSSKKLLVSSFTPLATFLNDCLFYIRPHLIQPGGSGDTSLVWATVFTYALVSVVGGIIWSVLDRKREEYNEVNYWLCLMLRYGLAEISFSYGITKIFPIQMSFPNLSQLATPLGDFLPMRLLWMFIGYGQPYQIFTGMAEVLVALLLIWRKTALLGALLAVGFFANVAMLNLSYDVPVKIFSLHLLFISIFLVWQERARLFAFFVQNKPVLPSPFFERQFYKKWQRWVRIGLKALFIVFYLGFKVFFVYKSYVNEKAITVRAMESVQPGVYHVELFVRNGDTIPESVDDASRWRDVIFDYNSQGSLAANDSTLVMSYGRAYFGYFPDSSGAQMEWRAYGKQAALFAIDFLGEDRMILRGKKGEDSLEVVLQSQARHFPLTERQFNWVNESVR